MEENGLLDSYLRHLRLPTFLKNYRQFSTDAAGKNLDHTRYLLALAELEVHQREHNMIQRRVKAAHFPVLKELADFDFSLLPSLNKAEILDLTRSEYLQKRKSIIFVGNPGLGKTHLATGIALAPGAKNRKSASAPPPAWSTSSCRLRMIIGCTVLSGKHSKWIWWCWTNWALSLFRLMALRYCLLSAQSSMNACLLSSLPI